MNKSSQSINLRHQRKISKIGKATGNDVHFQGKHTETERVFPKKHAIPEAASAALLSVSLVDEAGMLPPPVLSGWAS